MEVSHSCKSLVGPSVSEKRLEIESEKKTSRAVSPGIWNVRISSICAENSRSSKRPLTDLQITLVSSCFFGFFMDVLLFDDPDKCIRRRHAVSHTALGLFAWRRVSQFPDDL